MLAMSGCDPQEGVRFQSILDVEQQSIPKDSIFRKGLKCHPQSAIEIKGGIFFNLPVPENFWETKLFWKPRFRLPFIFTTTIPISTTTTTTTARNNYIIPNSNTDRQKIHHFQWIVVVYLQFSNKPPAIVAGS